MVPPKGLVMPKCLLALMVTLPVRIRLATSKARSMSPPLTSPDSRSELFAIAIASSSVSYGVAASTGPKISSWATWDSGSTWASRVRCHVVAGRQVLRNAAAGDQPDARVDAALDQPDYLVPLGLADLGAVHVAGCPQITDGEAFHHGLENGEGL